jgi:hypothetical protein
MANAPEKVPAFLLGITIMNDQRSARAHCHTSDLS